MSQHLEQPTDNFDELRRSEERVSPDIRPTSTAPRRNHVTEGDTQRGDTEGDRARAEGAIQQIRAPPSARHPNQGYNVPIILRREPQYREPPWKWMPGRIDPSRRFLK